ncbi:MAG: hypothetical protein ABL974_06210 [Prosthecobacter sp.]
MPTNVVSIAAASGKHIHHSLSFAILGDIKKPAFDGKDARKTVLNGFRFFTFRPDEGCLNL